MSSTSGLRFFFAPAADYEIGFLLCPSLARESGTVLALLNLACLTNPRVRLGRSPDELNIWAPFLFLPAN